VYTHYLYDAGGNRVKKYTRTAGGNWETITYIDGLIEYREDQDGKIQSINHVMDDTKRIATIRDGHDFGDTTPKIKYNFDDHLGSSNILVDDSGTLVNQEEYYPFGETSFGSYAKKRYRFCGKEKDEESGMYYYGARYYSPWLCRFISVDPLAGDYPFYTPYQYAGNQPINFIDLDGLEQAQPQTPSAGGSATTPPASNGTSQSAPIQPQSSTNISPGSASPQSVPGSGAGQAPASGQPQPGGGRAPQPGAQGPASDPQIRPEPKPDLRWAIPASVGAVLLTIIGVCIPNDGMKKGINGGTSEVIPDFGEFSPEPTSDSNNDKDNKDPYVYRAMEMDADGKPNVADGDENIASKNLGARPVDMKNMRNADGTLSPGENRGGMSVSKVPSFPKTVQDRIDSGKLVVFKIKLSELKKLGLTVDFDGGTHGAVQPDKSNTIELTYQSNIRKTRNFWILFK